MSSKQAIGMGYLRAEKFLDKIGYAPFKTYVMFIPDLPPLKAMTVDSCGEPVENVETASTLYDHYKNNAVEKFLAGMMTKKTLSPLDQKKLIMIIAIVAGAACGIYLMFMRRRTCRS